jgi:hypothetical protein
MLNNLLLSVPGFRELLRRNHFTCVGIDGVEKDHALGEPAGTPLALYFKPPIVGQTAVEIAPAPQVHRAHIPHRFPN